MRAKFRVIRVERRDVGNNEIGAAVELVPVVGGSPENEDFYRWTPAGVIKLETINGAAAAPFEVNKEFYIDFTPAG